MEGYDADLPPILPEAVSGALLLAVLGFSVRVSRLGIASRHV